MTRWRRLVTNRVRRLLLVEDDDLERAVFRHHLRAGGWYVEEASTAAEALAMAQRSAYDTIVLDYWLPDKSGPATIQAIRAAARAANLVVMTGDPSPLREKEALAGGADGFWPKSSGSLADLDRRCYRAAHA